MAELKSSGIPPKAGTFKLPSGGWFGPVILALLLNVGLFGVMPGLIRTVSEKPSFKETLSPVNVIRMKRAETPTRKKERKKPPKEKKRKVKPITKTRIATQKPVAKKYRLPFKLNPKLPVGAQTLTMPPMEMLDINAPEMKDTYGINEIDAPVTALVKIPPIYPLRAKRRGVEGWVSVRLLISEGGSVSTVEIIKAEPEGIFEKSVLNCVRKWKFKAGTVEGVPVKTWAQTTIRFQLER